MPRQAYNTISRLDKERLREVYRNGGDFLNLATQLNINRTTAYNIVRREVVEKKRGGKLTKKLIVPCWILLSKYWKKIPLSQFQTSIKSFEDGIQSSQKFVTKFYPMRLTAWRLHWVAILQRNEIAQRQMSTENNTLNGWWVRKS